MSEHDAPADELELQGDAAASARDPGEDGSVVWAHPCRGAPSGGGFAEAGDDIGGLERHPGVGAHGEAGVVIELVEDLEAPQV